MTLSSPDQLNQIILLGIEEIIGMAETKSLLTRANPPEWNHPDRSDPQGTSYSFHFANQLQTSLEKNYGLLAGRGLAVRAGRACFKHILREFAPEMGVMDPEARLLPLPGRINTTLRSLAGLFNQQIGLHIEVAPEADYIRWNIEQCNFCGDRQSSDPVCYFTVGLLEELLYWTSAGKFYRVEETHCIGCGDPYCSFQIKKQPFK